MTTLMPHTWHSSAWDRLVEARTQHRLPHALLLAGPEGVGKRRFARALANYLLCQQPSAAATGEQWGACGQCRACILFTANSHPDLVWITPEENSKTVKVDQIRALTDFVVKTSQLGGMKIAVIEPAESMNINAANALLKNLEEPGTDMHLVLISDAPGRLLPTIRSRCLQTAFAVPPTEQCLPWLAAATGSNESATRLLSLAGGRPLAALAMHEGDALSVRDGLRDIWFALWQRQRDCFAVAAQWMEFEPADVLAWAALWLQDAIRSAAGGVAESLGDAEVAQRFVPLLEAHHHQGTAVSLLLKLDQVNEIRRQLAMGANPNKQLLLEHLAACLVSKHRRQI